MAAAPCTCCQQNEISVQDFHCGHVQAVSKGGDDGIINLRPICAPCNAAMGTTNMFEYQRAFIFPSLQIIANHSEIQIGSYLN